MCLATSHHFGLLSMHGILKIKGQRAPLAKKQPIKFDFSAHTTPLLNSPRNFSLFTSLGIMLASLSVGLASAASMYFMIEGTRVVPCFEF